MTLRADDRTDRISRFVERFGGALTDAGMPSVPSRAFAALLAAGDGRMTAAQLAAALQVSPASVSGGVRYLSHLGLIRRERERGTRRDVYVVMEDVWHDLMLRKDAIYSPLIAALTDGVEAVQGTQAEERMRTSLDFLVFVTGEMDAILQRWEKRKAPLEAAAR